MHNPETICKAIALYENGENQSQISRELGIPRATVRGWLKNRGPVLELVYRGDSKSLPSGVSVRIRAGLPSLYYSYILGAYLGDGYIDKQARTYRLRIFQNSEYQEVIENYVVALTGIFSYNKVGVYPAHKGKYKTLCVYNKYLPDMFPQHGPGRKHNRDIKLKGWQKEIVVRHPQAFLKGLLDSDGSRYTDRGYTMYSFSNVSKDIKKIFCWVCDMLELEYTKSSVQIFIRKREHVDKIDALYRDFYPRRYREDSY